jgi:hypothetical protein
MRRIKHIVMGSILHGACGSASVPKILQIFRRNKNRKIRRKAVYSAFKKVLEAEVIQFPRQWEKPRVPDHPIQPEQLHDYETIARWLKLADELLGSADPDSSDYQDSDDRKKA